MSKLRTVPTPALVGGVLMGVASLFGGIWIGSSQISLSWLFVVLGGGLSASVFVVQRLKGRVDVFSPVSLFSIAYLVLFVVRPVFDLTATGGPPPVAGRSVQEGYSLALAVAFSGAVAFVMGYWISTGSRLAALIPIPRRAWPTGTLTIPIIAVLFFSSIIIVALVRELGGVSGLMQFSSGRSASRSEFLASTSGYIYSAPLWLLSVGVLLIALGRSRNIWLSIGGSGLVVFSQITQLAAGNRSWFIPAVLSIVLVMYLLRSRRPRLITLLLALFVAFAVLIAAPRQYRQIETRQDSFTSTMVQAVLHPVDGLREFFIGLDTAMVPGLALEVQAIPESEPYQYGGTYLDDAMRPVPRSIWADKPRSGDEQLMEIIYPEFYANGIQFYFSMFGEPYYNLGIVGVFLFCFVFGILWRSLYQWLLRDSTNPIVIALYALNWPFLFVYLRGGVGVDFQRQVIAVLPALLVVGIAHLLAGRSPRTNTSRVGVHG